MKRYAFCMLVFALALFSMGRANAAMYIKFDGIDGSVTAAGHENWIELTSVQLGVTNSGGLAERGPVVATSFISEASPKLFLATVSGTVIPEVMIDFVSASAPRDPYADVKLENVRITSYQLGVDADPSPQETVTFDFGAITFRYFPQSITGGPSTPVEAEWTFAAAPVPEPYSWVLLAAGLLVVGVARRRAAV